MKPLDKQFEEMLFRRWKSLCVPNLVLSAMYFAWAATILLDAANDGFLLTEWDALLASIFLVQSFRFWRFACGIARLNRRMLTELFARLHRNKENRKCRQ